MGITMRGSKRGLFPLLTLAIALALPTAIAHAISVNDGPTITVDPSVPYAGHTSQYTFGTYASANEQVVQIVVTFPAGFDVSSAQLLSHPGTVSVSGQAVTVTFNPLIPPKTEFVFTLGNIVNGPGGTYTFDPIVFHTVHRIHINKPNPPQPIAQTAAPVTVVNPHLSLSLSASAISFDLYPEIPSTPQSVAVTVDSSHPFAMSRSISGQPELFGLAVTGQAAGAKPAGAATYTDTYSAEAPWTTEGDRTYSATVTYTVVQ